MELKELMIFNFNFNAQEFSITDSHSFRYFRLDVQFVSKLTPMSYDGFTRGPLKNKIMTFSVHQVK